MTQRGVRVSWVVIAVAAAVIGGYLLRYGEAAYNRQPAMGTRRSTVGSRQSNSKVTAPVSPSAACPSPTAPEPTLAPLQQEPAQTPPVSVSSTPATSTAPPKATAAAPAPDAAVDNRQPTPEAVPTPETRDPKPDPGAPSIQWDAPKFDFGKVYQQEEPAHEFGFTNVGTGPLRIDQVISTCGCTAGKLPEKPIPPGGKGSITITFLTGRLRGKVSKNLLVITNDPAQPRTMLTIKAEVQLEVEVIPSGIYFGSLKLGDSVERPVVLRPVDAKGFTIIEAKSEHPLIQVTRTDPQPDGGYQLTVKIGPVEKVGQLNSRITVRTDLAHQKELLIPIYGRAVDLSGRPGQ